MKYIRTKDGIKECEYLFECCALTKDNIEIQRQDIINQADAIEELCDEFVYCKDKKRKAFSPMTFTKKDISFYDDIYGAIWTDKGLIYVAKMNEKGELELLWLRNIKFIGLMKKEITATKNT